MRKLPMVLVSLITLCSLVVIGILIWLFAEADPIVYSYRDSASASPGPTFVIFNPFRNKQPEKVAEKMLNQLKNGECEEAISKLPLSPSKYSNICEKEADYKIKDWTLANRIDSGDTSKLHYRIKREGFSGYGGAVFVELERDCDVWKLVNLDYMY